MRLYLLSFLCLGLTSGLFSQKADGAIAEAWFLNLYSGAGLGTVKRGSADPERIDYFKPGLLWQPLIGFEAGSWLNRKLNISAGIRYQVKGYSEGNNSVYKHLNPYWMGLVNFEYLIFNRLSYQLGLSMGKGTGSRQYEKHLEFALLNTVKYYPHKNWAFSLGYNRGINPISIPAYGKAFHSSLDLAVHYRLNSFRISAN